MKLSEQLSANVEPIVRDYIFAVIDEALAPLREQLRIERAARDDMFREMRLMNQILTERCQALEASIIRIRTATGAPE